MELARSRILTINGGSSSIEFALCQLSDSLSRLLGWAVDRIGRPNATLRVEGVNDDGNWPRLLTAPNRQWQGALMDWVAEQISQVTTKQFDVTVTSEFGLLGISDTSGDVRDLLKGGATDTRAAEAFLRFCDRMKKGIGAFAATLGGVDTLVLSEGVGENGSAVRAHVCDGLQCLGVELSEGRNAANHGAISSLAGRVSVRVVRTDEERMIAKTARRVLHLGSDRET